jgi:alkanesulfonate monooxygenase
MLNGRLAINIISSEVPGEALSSPERYQRTRETMAVLRDLLNGQPVRVAGEFLNFAVEPPNARTVSGQSPLFYFGGLSEPAREVAAECADVFLMWPNTLPEVQGVLDDMRARAAAFDRTLRFGYRVHVIVRETEAAAIDASRRLMSKLDEEEGARIRAQSLDSTSAGVRAQGELRDAADPDGFAEANLWTGIGRARSGCGAAIVGDPDQVLEKLKQYQALGIEAFILSGYPHEEECDLFARYVLTELDHGVLT